MQIQIIFQLTIAGMNDNAIFLQYAQNMAELALMYCEARQPCYRPRYQHLPCARPGAWKTNRAAKRNWPWHIRSFGLRHSIRLQVAHSRSSFSCCSATERCPLPCARIQPHTREEKHIFFLVFHFTSHLRIVIRKNHPVPATRLDPTALDTESVHTVLQQRCKQSFQFRSATM